MLCFHSPEVFSIGLYKVKISLVIYVVIVLGCLFNHSTNILAIVG